MSSRLPEMPLSDRLETIKRYVERYNEFGYSPLTLGWNKGRQSLRFDALTSLYDCSEKRILDIGCGFGDLNVTLERKFGDRYSYIGIDLVEELVREARNRWTRSNIDFTVGDVLGIEDGIIADYAIASGVFNHRLTAVDNYQFIEATIGRTLSVVADGLAFDFLSDRVEFRREHTFHSQPSAILDIAYGFSRNVVLRNDYMPFEFSLFVFKDDSFDREKAVFNRSIAKNS